jgi:hypothetical protein
VLGGLPLIAQALVAARSDRRLAAGLALPVVALAAFAALTAALLALAPAEASLAVKLALLVPWWTSGALCALAIGWAPRIVLARFEPSPRALRRAALAGPALVLAMAVVSGGIAVYALTLGVVAPDLAAESGGPIFPATVLTLAAGAFVAAAASVLATVAGTRALRATRQSAG